MGVDLYRHLPIFAGLVLESGLELADCSAELTDSSPNFIIVSQQPLSNMFNSHRPICVVSQESAGYCNQLLVNWLSG